MKIVTKAKTGRWSGIAAVMLILGLATVQAVPPVLNTDYTQPLIPPPPDPIFARGNEGSLVNLDGTPRVPMPACKQFHSNDEEPSNPLGVCAAPLYMGGVSLLTGGLEHSQEYLQLASDTCGYGVGVRTKPKSSGVGVIEQRGPGLGGGTNPSSLVGINDEWLSSSGSVNVPRYVPIGAAGAPSLEPETVPQYLYVSIGGSQAVFKLYRESTSPNSRYWWQGINGAAGHVERSYVGVSITNRTFADGSQATVTGILIADVYTVYLKNGYKHIFKGFLPVDNYSIAVSNCPPTHDVNGNPIVPPPGCLANDYSAGKLDIPKNGSLLSIADYCGKVLYGTPSWGSWINTVDDNEHNWPDGSPLYSIDGDLRKYAYKYKIIEPSDFGVSQTVLSTITAIDSVDPAKRVGSVEFDYYEENFDQLSAFFADLRMATARMPVTDLTSPSTDVVWATRRTYYRYDGQVPGELVLVISEEGLQAWARDHGGEDSLLPGFGDGQSVIGIDSATLDQLQSYADFRVLTRESSAGLSSPITSIWQRGACSSCGESSGVYTYSYQKNNASDKPDPSQSGYQKGWLRRTIVGQPDGSRVIQYFDSYGQPLSRVVEAADENKTWWNYIVRDSRGMVESVHTPENVTVAYGAYSTPTALAPTVLPPSALNGSAGAVTVYNRFTSTNGPIEGLLSSLAVKQGTGGSAVITSGTTFTTQTATLSSGIAALSIPFVQTRKRYPTEGAPAERVCYAYTFWSPGVVKKITMSEPTTGAYALPADLGNRVVYLRCDGTTAFTKDQAGRIDYSLTYRGGTRAVRIQDRHSEDLAGRSDVPIESGSSWGLTLPLSSSTGGRRGIAIETATDTRGRPTRVTRPGHAATAPSSAVAATMTERIQYARLVDGREVSFSNTLGGYSSAQGLYSPGRYVAYNYAGSPIVQATVAANASGGAGFGGAQILSNQFAPDPILSLPEPLRGTSGENLTDITVSQYDTGGKQLLWMAKPVNSIVEIGGVSGGDRTEYGYDVMGRVSRVTLPSLAVTETVYDRGRGLPIARRMGKSSGTMATVERMEYDANASGGNGRLTSRTVYPSGDPGVGSSARTTTYSYDHRGRLVTQKTPDDTTTLIVYDNLDRALATGRYSTPGTTTISGDPRSQLAGRLSLNEVLYNVKGQVFRTIDHSINPTTGAVQESITSDRVFDDVGRVIRTTGASVAKMEYDIHGRVVRQASLASTSGTTDRVLEETRTVYDTIENSGLPIMQVRANRHVDDDTAAAWLDTSGPGLTSVVPSGINGRVQITSFWYDYLGRQMVTAQLGTNNEITLEMRGSGTWKNWTTLDANAILTHTYFDDFGRVNSVSTPNAAGTGWVQTQYAYDVQGRKIAEIRNATGDGVGSSGPDRDHDLYTRYAYRSGQMTKMWVDITGTDTAGEASTSQITEYQYGFPQAGNPLAGGLPGSVVYPDLLSRVIYPPGAVTGGSDLNKRTVFYAYNALGEQIATQDQNGTRHIFTYDGAGRRVADGVSQFGTDIDQGVQAIELGYTPRGQVETVTQKNGPTILDQVKYSYDGWGNVVYFDQDRNSAVGASGSLDQVRVSMAYERTAPAGGRIGIRRTQEALTGAGASAPIVQSVAYQYGASGSIDDLTGRVTGVFVNGSEVRAATYQYMGAASLVSTALTEPQAVQRRYTPASGTNPPTYPQLDRFNRIVTDSWRGISDDRLIYQLALTYDFAGNITSTKDGLLTARDVRYRNDNLGRLIGSQEGTINAGGVITLPQRQEGWTNPATGTDLWSSAAALSQTGNWTNHWRADDGSSSAIAAAAFKSTATYSLANEVLTRSITTPAGTTTPPITPTHDAAGNQVRDGEHFIYTYDAWGRMVQVNRKTATLTPGALVARYRYNGLGYRIGWRYDANLDDVTQETTGQSTPVDPWYWLVYNDRWQHIGTWRAGNWDYASGSINDVYPKETFVHHAAGLDGRGGSSYIDAVILRDRDNGNGGVGGGWTDPCTTALRGARLYYLQNWRADVVVTMNEGGELRDQVRYSPYGVPTRLSIADITATGGTYSNGAVDLGPDGGLSIEDFLTFLTAFSEESPLADLVGAGSLYGRDGRVSIEDFLTFLTAFGEDVDSTGRGLLARSDTPSGGNRRGYAGYEYAEDLRFASRNVAVPAGGSGANATTQLRPRAMYQVRNRVYDAEQGRWTRRDPIGYFGGLNFYAYVTSSPIAFTDMYGLCGNSMCGISDESYRYIDPQDIPPQIPLDVVCDGDKDFVDGLNKARECLRNDTERRLDCVDCCMYGSGFNAGRLQGCLQGCSQGYDDPARVERPGNHLDSGGGWDCAQSCASCALFLASRALPFAQARNLFTMLRILKNLDKIDRALSCISCLDSIGMVFSRSINSSDSLIDNLERAKGCIDCLDFLPDGPGNLKPSGWTKRQLRDYLFRHFYDTFGGVWDCYRCAQCSTK